MSGELQKFMAHGNERLYILKQTCRQKLRVCFSDYNLLLPPRMNWYRHIKNFYFPLKMLEASPYQLQRCSAIVAVLKIHFRNSSCIENTLPHGCIPVNLL